MGVTAPVQLSEAEELEIWNLYINDDLLPAAPISGPLASYLALFFICGPAALGNDPLPPVEVDSWTVWRAASPALRNVLKREGAAIAYPEAWQAISNAGGMKGGSGNPRYWMARQVI